jgi:endonuclease/exonuclease/phosphatase family metal-dependent hydrolase
MRYLRREWGGPRGSRLRAVVRGWIGRVALVALFMGAAGAAPAELTIATYNVENYLATDRMVDGVFRQDFPKPENAKTALRRVIREMNADVLAIQEMGGLPYLLELQRDLKRDGVHYPHLAHLEAEDSDRHVAVLSKHELRNVGKWTDLSFRYFGGLEKVKRGLLKVEIATRVGAVTLYVCHLKSRITERSDDPASALRRLGEATAIRNHLLLLHPVPSDARVVLVGDLNDSPRSKPVKALLKRGEVHLFELLPASDSRDDSWTHFYRKEETYSRVDYILVSPALLPHVVGDRATVVDAAEVRRASDHRPVLMRLAF